MTRLDSHQKHGIGVFLRAARRSMGLRQGDLAALTGLPTSHLSDIERGMIIPTLSTLSTIAEALNRPIGTGYTLNLTVAIAEREYSKLAPDIQQILVEAAYQAGEYCTQLAQKQTMVDLRMLNEEYNIPVIHPDEGEWRSRFSWALREVCYGKRLAPELYDAIQEL